MLDQPFKSWDGSILRSLDEARKVIERWRVHCNEVWPLSSLDYLPPAVFSAKAEW